MRVSLLPASPIVAPVAFCDITNDEHRTAIEMLWDWGFTWKNISFIDTGIGIDAHKSGMDSNTGRVQGVGVSYPIRITQIIIQSNLRSP